MKNKALLTGLCILLVELLVAILLWLFGFRITYSPTLENSWDAISACAAWASVVVAGLAIYYAILVPKKIAAEQNSIALFEKRHGFYIAFCKCVSFCRSLDIVRTSAEARRIFYHVFCENPTAQDDASIQLEVTPIQMKTVSVIDQGIYLFDFETESYLGAILGSLVEVLSPTNTEAKFEEHRKLLIAAGSDAEKALTSQIVNTLKVPK